MGLSVYLTDPNLKEETCVCSCCDNEHTKGYYETLFQANITHNLVDMAWECGVYKYVWRPHENNITQASELIEPLTKGIALLESDPERFKAFNPENGWGSYDGFVKWLKNYLEACKAHPHASIEVSR